MAERGGFEPPNGKYPVNGFRDRRLRPLSHLSVCMRNISILYTQFKIIQEKENKKFDYFQKV